METVFSYCGTLSLEKQLVPVGAIDDMQIGDVLIRGGSPGHAMLVVDMAADSMGHQVYLLAQSYMPAQDIHIVNNPRGEPWVAPGGGSGVRTEGRALSPWYRVDKRESMIETPEWTFYTRQLRGWPRRPGG
ncbi:MAG TPA: DUF4846 domain-containing protein [Puia sp.]|nr:DUF4846 domain-containing protein [Puia sp.]